MTQPPIHWSPENLAFAYLATALALGMEATLSLPLDVLFEASPRVEPRSEWARDAVDMRRALDGVRPHLEPDATAVLLLDRQPAAAVVASVLGAVGAGFRLRDADVRRERPGHHRRRRDDPARRRRHRWIGASGTRPGPTLPRAARGRPATGPFRRDELEAAIAELAVSVLQARGEPARYERLLGEVLLGLDRSGHLRRVTSLWPDLTPPGRAGGHRDRAVRRPSSTPTTATTPGTEQAAAVEGPTQVRRRRGPGVDPGRPVRGGATIRRMPRDRRPSRRPTRQCRPRPGAGAGCPRSGARRCADRCAPSAGGAVHRRTSTPP